MRPLRALAIIAPFAAASLGDAAALTYEKDVLPILKKNCLKCHNNEKMKGGVSMEVADMKGDIGRIVIPGDPVESMLLEVLVRDDIKNTMPPKGGKLAQRDIDKIRTWIVDGAHFRGDAKAGEDDKPAAGLGKKPLPGTWTNKAGKAIKADLLRVEDDKAVLRMANGRIYKYPLGELDPRSAAKAREYMGTP